MSPSIHTLVDEFKSFVFEKNELENHDNWTLIELLVNQDSNPDVKGLNICRMNIWKE